MSETYTYLLVDTFCLAGPLLLSFYPKFRFYTNWKYFIIPCIIVGALFIAWDVLYTSLGVWGFNHRYTLGHSLLGLPLEEYLFFLCIPFACVFTYHAFNSLFNFQRTFVIVYKFYLFLSAVLMVVAVIYTDRLYTSATFFLLSIALGVCSIKRMNFLPTFFFSFLFILIPFVISNGILTGSFLNRVVVYYNDEENIGLRILTIPVEDVFYGMLLLLLNVYGYEWILQRKSLPRAGNY